MRLRFLVLSIAVCLAILSTYAKVAPTTLENLIRISDFVVIGHVDSVARSRGTRIATVTVQEVLKGDRSQQQLQFLAQPTWTCDISGAEKGETVLLFLIRPEQDQGDEEGDSFFRTPAGAKGVLRIAWSGRGRMPLRKIGGEDYVTLWPGDVRLPDTMQTVDGPEKEYVSFIRSVRLSDLVLFIRTRLESSSAKAGR